MRYSIVLGGTSNVTPAGAEALLALARDCGLDVDAETVFDFVSDAGDLDNPFTDGCGLYVRTGDEFVKVAEAETSLVQAFLPLGHEFAREAFCSFNRLDWRWGTREEVMAFRRGLLERF